MKRFLILFAIALVVLAGCGGGGGGTGGSNGGASGSVVGRVLSVQTGGPVSPAATVQVGSNTSSTSTADGSFTVDAPTGSTNLIVDTHNQFGVWNFTIPAVNGTVDAGDLWVGPEQVTVTGQVVSSADNLPVAGATVSFAGRTATTNAQGIFSLSNVAYSSSTQTAFWGIVGTATASQFFKSDFSAAPAVANNGIVTVNDIVLTPLSDDDPPPLPGNIVGRVTPLAQASGTVVTLKDNSGNAVRTFNVGPSGGYSFWVSPGTYTLEFQNGTLTAPTQSVNLTATDQVFRVSDVALDG